jgi:hypothetical protein
MNYDPKDVVGDFARRTKQNLVIIEALASTHLGARPHPQVWDFTQLVNSLLGLLVFPQQEWFDKLPETPLAAMPPGCWPTLHITRWDRRHRKGPNKGQLKDKTFKEVAICLRNSISHFNVEFEGDSRDNIDRIRLWNVADESQPNARDFEVVLTTEQVRQIALTFIDSLAAPVGNIGGPHGT